MGPSIAFRADLMPFWLMKKRLLYTIQSILWAWWAYLGHC